MKYTSDHYLNAVNTEILQTSAHTLFGASLGYTSPDDHWELSVVGTNLTDKRVLKAGFDGAAFFGFTEGSYNAPRTYTVHFSYHL